MNFTSTGGIILATLFSVGLSVIYYDGFPFLHNWMRPKRWVQGNGYKSNHDRDHERIQTLIENIKIIERHNAKYDRGETSFRMKINPFADMHVQEFSKLMNGYKMELHTNSSVASTFLSPRNVNIPKEIDWRDSNAVTPPKSQGSCGACWAFSATGSMESQEFRKSGKLVPLSEQNLIDCSKKYGNQGCQGGQMELAFEYVKDNKGINKEAIYPYEGKDDKECRYKQNNEDIGTVVTGTVKIQGGNESQLQEAVAVIGPISVAMDASHTSFQFYDKGIYYEPNCSSKSLNHAVLLIGYGTSSKGEDFWIIKNSWGTQWGEKGYAKMARNRENNCGIATAASYPLV